jgi:hypothetical protein
MSDQPSGGTKERGGGEDKSTCQISHQEGRRRERERKIGAHVIKRDKG